MLAFPYSLNSSYLLKATYKLGEYLGHSETKVKDNMPLFMSKPYEGSVSIMMPSLAESSFTGGKHFGIKAKPFWEKIKVMTGRGHLHCVFIPANILGYGSEIFPQLF